MDETRKLHIDGGSKFCPKCGTENSQAAKFCASCGESFNRRSQQDETSEFERRNYEANREFASSSEQNQSYNRNYEEPIQRRPTSEFSNEYSNERSNTIEESASGLGTGAIIAIIIAGIISAAILVFIVIQVVDKNKSSDNSGANLEAKVEEVKKENELQQMKNEQEVERRLKEEEQKRELSSKEREIQELRSRLESKPTVVTNTVPVPVPSAPTTSSGSDGSYVMSSSNSSYISNAQLSNMSKSEIELVRNEIYARRGYIFKEQRFRDYFGKKSWYYPNSGFHDGMFNAVEKANIDTIVAYEKARGWR